MAERDNDVAIGIVSCPISPVHYRPIGVTAIVIWRTVGIARLIVASVIDDKTRPSGERCEMPAAIQTDAPVRLVHPCGQ